MWKFANSTNINTLFTIISTLLGFESLTQGWGAVFTIACFTLAILLIIKLIQGHLKTRHSRAPSEPPNSFFPPYLCYLPNRNKQTIKLRDAIKAHEDYSIKQRPLVCLIPGEHQESHYGFKACFVGETLPKLYCGIKDAHDVHCIELTLCDCSADHLELQDDIFNQLMEKLPHYPPEYTKAGVSQLLAEQGKPVIVSLDISIEDCQPVKDIIEKGLIEFWRDWPAPQAHDLINQHGSQYYRLLVLMCFRYPDTTQTHFKFRNHFSQSSRLRRKVMRQLDGLDKALYDSGMGLVVLPQLDAVKKEAAIEWLRDDCKHHLMLGYETLKDRETKIRQLYEGQAHGISMEILASQLKDILQETTV